MKYQRKFQQLNLQRKFNLQIYTDIDIGSAQSVVSSADLSDGEMDGIVKTEQTEEKSLCLETLDTANRIKADNLNNSIKSRKRKYSVRDFRCHRCSLSTIVAQNIEHIKIYHCDKCHWYIYVTNVMLE